MPKSSTRTDGSGPVALQKDVGWLEVAVHQPDLVPGRHAARRLAQDVERGAQPQGLLPGQPLAQAFAPQQLHDQEIHPRVGAHVQHGHQVGVHGQARGHGASR
jgi:hypothetical protein